MVVVVIVVVEQGPVIEFGRPCCLSTNPPEECVLALKGRTVDGERHATRLTGDLQGQKASKGRFLCRENEPLSPKKKRRFMGR